MTLSQHESSRVRSLDSQSTTDVVVIGAGIAGLSFALRLPETISLVVLTKSQLGESNTRYAQGGMAAAIGPEDSAELHLEDTVGAGAGLTDIETATGLVERGASAVRWLLLQGAKFDLDGNTLHLGNEAAHSRRRILHAGGDATGAEIERALVARLRRRKNTRIVEYGFAIDLVLTEDESVGGVTVLHNDGGLERIVARTTVLANGGAGRIWNITSNPYDASGDGIAMAMRAGVDLADLEFCQFHPTVLRKDGITPFLISEAVRGEGAYLVNSTGERFMLAIDPRAELAPRNVVAGAIQRQLTQIPDNKVYLDVRHLGADLIRHRFPTIEQMLSDAGVSMGTELIPVAPAAHYYMGGVVADSHGRTSKAGLLAIGEVACTGVHGANRLASNSLLEGLVFGINASDALENAGLPNPGTIEPAESPSSEPVPETAASRKNIRRRMTEWVGVVRNRDDMLKALAYINDTPDTPPVIDREALISRNIHLVSKLVTLSALDREESRGGHIRTDFPETDPELDGQHQLVSSFMAGDDLDVVRWFGELHANWPWESV